MPETLTPETKEFEVRPESKATEYWRLRCEDVENELLILKSEIARSTIIVSRIEHATKKEIWAKDWGTWSGDILRKARLFQPKDILRGNA